MPSPSRLRYLIPAAGLLTIPFYYFVLLMLAFSFDDPSTSSSRAARFMESEAAWYGGLYAYPATTSISLVLAHFHRTVASWITAFLPALYPLFLIGVRIVWA